jgi:hypothetical protein
VQQNVYFQILTTASVPDRVFWGLHRAYQHFAGELHFLPQGGCERAQEVVPELLNIRNNFVFVRW